MLQIFHRIAQTLAFKIFIGVLVASFIFLWGVGDLWQQFMSPAHATLVSVGGRTIKMDAFSRKLQHQMEMAQRMAGNRRLQPEDYRRLQLEVATLQEMVVGELVDQECDRLGIHIPVEVVVPLVHRDPLFHGKNGTFDRARFNQVLQVLRMNEDEYIETLRGDLRRRQLLSVVTRGIQAPQVLGETFIKRFHQKLRMRILDVPLLPVAKVPGQKNAVPAPTEDTIAQFYTTNKDYYAIPERRSFKILHLRYADLPHKVTDDQVKNAFESRVGKKEKVKFEDVKEELRRQLLREANADAMETLKSFIDDKVAGGVSLDDVSTLVRTQGAGKAGMTTVTLTALKTHAFHEVTQGGQMGPKGEKSVVEALQSQAHVARGDIQNLIGLVFATQKGSDSETHQLPSGDYVIVHVDEVEPRRIPEYEEVKADVTDVVIREAQFKATYDMVTAYAETLKPDTQKADKHKKVPPLEAKFGGSLRDVFGLRYELASQAQKFDLVGFENRADDVNKDDIVILPNVKNKSIQIIQVSSVEDTDFKSIKPEIIKQLTANLTREMQNDVQNLYLAYLQKRYKVDYNKDVLKTLGLKENAG
ncbi:MAG: SurA N-terminal domain-containing protein [Alphaproteobacteria bacterium]|nr:MAG: SurA N-terminal domain-containing protein [Alphaproteobacteria bacterium]